MSAGVVDDRSLLRLMPALFVLIWSTGFVVARFGMPHAPPIGFLAWRYALSVLAFLVWITLARAPWPRTRVQWAHLAVTGILMHAGYLGGVWAAVKAGLGAGMVALVVGLQPVLTAMWMSSWGGQRIAPSGHRHRSGMSRGAADADSNPRSAGDRRHDTDRQTGIQQYRALLDVRFDKRRDAARIPAQ